MLNAPQLGWASPFGEDFECKGHNFKVEGQKSSMCMCILYHRELGLTSSQGTFINYGVGK